MSKTVKIVLVVFVSLLAVTGAAVLLVLAAISALEYRPKETEDVSVKNNVQKEAQLFSPIKILSWNIGYGDLGNYADFFMDGGKHVQNSTKEQVIENLNAFVLQIKNSDADIAFLQEADLRSKRSYKINEAEFISSALPKYSSSFAYNFKAAYVPYPFPPIGKVSSGLLTLSSFFQSSAQRISLPVPFKWPVRVANLKRCLLVSRVPVKQSDKELVLVNLHLEAFDSGEGKIEQTKKLRSFIQAESEKGNYVIVGGDFNQTFSNTDISSYYQWSEGWKAGLIETSDFSSVWTFLQDSSVPTCRSNRKVYKDEDKSTYQFFCIDGFIVSSNVKVSSVQTLNLDFVNSDHNPVLLEFFLE